MDSAFKPCLPVQRRRAHLPITRHHMIFAPVNMCDGATKAIRAHGSKSCFFPTPTTQEWQRGARGDIHVRRLVSSVRLVHRVHDLLQRWLFPPGFWVHLGSLGPKVLPENQEERVALPPLIPHEMDGQILAAHICVSAPRSSPDVRVHACAHVVAEGSTPHGLWCMHPACCVVIAHTRQHAHPATTRRCIHALRCVAKPGRICRRTAAVSAD